jgi:hypothetical protein
MNEDPSDRLPADWGTAESPEAPVVATDCIPF